MKPYIGQTVHYKSYGSPGGEFQSEKRAAIITAVHNEKDVCLCVLNPTGFYFNLFATKGNHAGQWNYITEAKEDTP